MDKALNAGADALILDLEDSVAPAHKDAARANVRAFVKANSAAAPQLWVRINPLAVGALHADLAAAAIDGVAGVVLPKPSSAADAIELAAELDRCERPAVLPAGRIMILPIATETPLAIFNLHTYAGATPRLGGLTWGAEDLSAAVGASTARTEAGLLTPLYELARSLCIAAAAAAGVPAIETVYPEFRDASGLVDYLARARRDGFVGMMAIHPSQVAAINAAFTPSEHELRHAQEVVALFAANPDAGTLALNGKMLDAPHHAQALRIIERARRR